MEILIRVKSKYSCVLSLGCMVKLASDHKSGNVVCVILVIAKKNNRFRVHCPLKHRGPSNNDSFERRGSVHNQVTFDVDSRSMQMSLSINDASSDWQKYQPRLLRYQRPSGRDRIQWLTSSASGFQATRQVFKTEEPQLRHDDGSSHILHKPSAVVPGLHLLPGRWLCLSVWLWIGRFPRRNQ